MKRLFTSGFFLTIFFLAIRPLRDFDIWFHLKSGEIILTKGLIRYDVFSYTAAGRRWYPYEWLYQVTMYLSQQFFGLESIKIITAIFITLLVFFLWKIMRRIFQIPELISAISCFFFFVSIHEFFTARPHIPAYLLFTITLYLILLYVKERVNRLYLLIPIFLVWSNFHGSVFVGIMLIAAYGFINVITKRNFLLLASTPVAFLLTILPPIRTLQYELLWEFSKNLNLIRKFIDEWTPLSTNPYAFIFYSLSTALIFVLFFFNYFRHRKNNPDHFWLLPLLPFPFLAYTASRNLFFGYLALTLMLAMSIQYLWHEAKTAFFRGILIGTGIVLIAAHVWILSQKLIPERLYYPVNAVKFIKQYKPDGNMFNEYGYGGYLLYHLYPEYKVFFDGRTDVYLCCEIRETLDLARQKQLPDQEYKKLLDTLWQKHDVSFVILRTQKHSVLRKISRILTADPTWSLVFWDDHSVLFVRRDGKNDRLIEAFGAKFATPYERNPFPLDRENEAFAEYARMIKVVDSSRSRNALGYIYLKQGRFVEAKTEFEKALSLDPTFESPYMNIAELAYHAGDRQTAINFYQAARKIAPDRGLIYLRLAQILLTDPKNRTEAVTILERGIANTVDEDVRTQLKTLLEKLK